MRHCTLGGVRGAWNHNTHYHRALIRRLPVRVDRALDIGCGDGTFARLLAARARDVVAIDVDRGEVERARSSSVPDNVRWECVDFLAYEPGDGAFDLVTALAVTHHLPFDEALAKMHRLLAPGGRLLVLGLWPSTASPADVAVSAVASVATQTLQIARGRTWMTSPAREPEMPLGEVRRRAATVLPGATVQRLLLWRYIVDWTKPA